MNWTKTKPTEGGFYWFRENELGLPVIIEIYEDRIWKIALGSSAFNVNGEFWPEKLVPPTAQTSQNNQTPCTQ